MENDHCDFSTMMAVTFPLPRNPNWPRTPSGHSGHCGEGQGQGERSEAVWGKREGCVWE